MPRTARLDIPGLLHHVILRGIERRPIFQDDQDRAFFLYRFSFLLQETQTDCLAWSLLTNHVHLLLRPRADKLSSFMRRLLTSYAVTFNLRHKRSGHLFQNRYKSLLCEEESYFLELVRYVHLNPLRAGLVGSLDELSGYPWCGHAVVMGKRSLEGQVTEEVLERFGKTKTRARGKYLTFLADGLGQDAPDPEQVGSLRRWLAERLGLEKELSADERILGAEDFGRMAQPNEEAGPLAAVPLPKLLERVASVFGVPPQSLLRRTRTAGVAEARAVFCHLGVRACNYSGAEISRLLRMSRSGVTIAVARGGTLLEERPELQKLAAN